MDDGVATGNEGDKMDDIKTKEGRRGSLEESAEV